jgi:hypothetical protein
LSGIGETYAGAWLTSWLDEEEAEEDEEADPEELGSTFESELTEDRESPETELTELAEPTVSARTTTEVQVLMPPDKLKNPKQYTHQS